MAAIVGFHKSKASQRGPSLRVRLGIGLLCPVPKNTVTGEQIDQGDVIWDPTPSAFAGVGLSILRAQSFIPTVQNISSIEIHIYKESEVTGNLTIYVTKTFDGDEPTPQEINGTIEITPDAVPLPVNKGWTKFNFSELVEITPLETYYFVLQGYNDSGFAMYYWTFDQGNPYTNGTSAIDPSYDQFFKTYYEEPVVPEFPSEILLVILPVTIIALTIIITNKQRKAV